MVYEFTSDLSEAK